MQFVPYLNFDGNCAEAFRFYEECFCGKLVAMFTHKDTPMADQVSAEWGDRIMHARLIVNGAVLMGSDCPPGAYERSASVWVSLMVEEPAEADRIYAALVEGGSPHMPIQETFWAQRFGMVIDRFGTPWMINCERPMS